MSKLQPYVQVKIFIMTRIIVKCYFMKIHLASLYDHGQIHHQHFESS